MPDSTSPPLPPRRALLTLAGRVRAYLELARVPNVLTAVADVMMGYLVTRGLVGRPTLEPGSHFGLLAAASCLLYTAGMVLNDVFDVEEDARERPERPIPSGRVPLPVARIVGWELLIGGAACAWLVSYFADRLWPGVMGTLLASCVLLYDGLLKRTPFGPAGMASCRALNVLLGMSLAGGFATSGILPWSTAHWWIAAGIGVYVYGITQIARDEAFGGSRAALLVGTVVLLGGMTILACLPLLVEQMQPNVARWRLLWAVLFLLVGWRCVRAIIDPRPVIVRGAVKHAILSIIFLDAAVTAGICGSFWGISVLLLVIPAMLMGKWFEST